MRNSSITDWIQAIAVVVGVGFAIRELVIYDRASELNQRAAVSNLLLAGQSDAVMDAYRELLRGKKNMKESGALSETEWFDLQLAVSPIKEHFLTWSFCYSASLCDRSLVLDAVCFRAKTYEKIMKEMRPATISEVPEKRRTYISMLEDCEKLSD